MAKRSSSCVMSWLVSLFLIVLLAAGSTRAQSVPAAGAQVQPQVEAGAQTGQNGAALALTLQDALEGARANNPEFKSAQVDLGVAREDKYQARVAFLPSVNHTTQRLHTQANGTDTGVFVASNGVNEYLSQAAVHQELGFAQVAAYRRAGAAEALSRAKLEIASRGLVVTVTKSFYDVVVGQRKYATAQLATAEAKRFLDISQSLERGGEVAHSDLLKAQIQFEQKQRDLREAELSLERSRVVLAVLVFPSFQQDFSVVDDLAAPKPLPSRDDVRAKAALMNPDVAVAEATLRQAHQDVAVAKSGHLPSIAFDYFYGIDAPRFATRTAGISNLGFGTVATVQLPIWNWGATQSKVRQAQLHRQQAQVELSLAQRQLLGNLQTFYNEAEAALSEMESLSRTAVFAAESLRLTTMRYQGGEATVLEVVDAQNTLTEARNAFDEGQSRYRLALAQLQTLTGEF